MANLPSLPDVASLGDLFSAHPEFAEPLLTYTDAVLREESEFTIGERELMAAYVSGLNACRFCHDSHKIYAQAFGINEGVIDALLVDITTAPISDKLKPVLRYIQKLNTLPCQIERSDTQAVLDAGWSEKALFGAIQVCALFNLFNRIVEGSGVNFNYQTDAQAHPAAVQSTDDMAHSYRDFARRLGLSA